MANVNENLHDQVAIVTGGGRGLGRAMALGLARAGYRVVATAAREQDEVNQLAADVRAELGDDRVLPLMADVTRETDCATVVTAARGHGQRLNILVNNAGRGMKYVSEDFLARPTRFWETEPDVWRMVIDTNVNGPFLMARAVLPQMLAQGWGRIINISMNRSTMRRQGFSPYGPSKAALESETSIWAQDLDGTGVTVNALLPGGASATGMIPAGVPEAVRAKLLDPVIMVEPLLWLASSQSDGINGQRLVADRWSAASPTEGLEAAGWGNNQ